MRWRAFLVGAAVVVVGLLARGPSRFLRGVPRHGDGETIRVEVLNGSGVYKAGLGLAMELRRQGFDVVTIGNADHSGYAETLVLDRVGMPEHADSVVRRLGFGRALQQRNEELLVDVTVILGKDRGDQYGGRT
jgi:hypothetical protein